MSGPFSSGHKVFNTELNPMLLGWIDFTWFATTLAYVSADAPTFVFSVNADVTAVIEPGMRIKLTQTTDKFFIVTAVGAYAAGVTPITVYGGTDYTLANAAISAGAFSTHKKPFGFNASPAKWTEKMTDTSDRAQASAVSGTWYNPGSLSLSVPIGAWYLEWSAEVVVNASTSVQGTLSTSSSSASDSEFQAEMNAGFDSLGGRRKAIVVAAKTTYFLNIMTRAGSSPNIQFHAATTGVPTIVRAVCAYL